MLGFRKKPESTTVSHRLDDLEDKVEHLLDRFDRLRSQVSRMYRRLAVDELPNEPTMSQRILADLEAESLPDEHALGAKRRFGRS